MKDVEYLFTQLRNALDDAELSAEDYADKCREFADELVMMANAVSQ